MNDIVNKIDDALRATVLNEEAIAPPPFDLEKAVHNWLKTKLGVAPRSLTLNLNDSRKQLSGKVEAKGPHGTLLKDKDYDVVCDVWSGKDPKHGEFYACKADLNWEYADGGRNGKAIGSVFFNSKGAIIKA